ncbi:DegT/DnrJ/EryC1/StrS family aminotransferase [Romeria aff. gracilis LEGE 07310]|uniref:DegT/DnrJ/EryC1/StrS family aminotransferase n=1 Tax=Vasconcelosia minhoensis LEGE 07310 TaxID=915328 RepID=A0A8J7B156_9CYAN|nr:DegT/DnrJ/EryC1/StrS family aminotransferase [Romeria gracilis]MBE9080442.1 DegT/DnrJ/EryC1/StrS family aminotransferase [Romeria aff. gracilis LEGE 07310]
MSKIPPLDLTRQYATIEAEISQAVTAVLASGQYINGPVVQHFAQQFGDYIGTTDCVVCNSGTDALYLALRALQIGPGDEVITSPFTFIGTAEAISAVGATPVFVDVDLDGLNLDPAQIEATITKRTKAIMPVHLFGRPVDMDALMAVAQAYQIPVIEDCAQAVGGQWGPQRVGGIGRVGCFSFFPTKNLGACGDGGALTTNDPALAETAQMLAAHGSRSRYRHEAIGINSRLDAVQAAILQVKLQYLDRWNQQRQVVAERYTQLLGLLPGIQVPGAPSMGKSVWHQYTVLLKPSEAGSYRDRVRQLMQDQGVATMVYYPIPLHRQPVYQSLGYGAGTFPRAEQAAGRVLALPMFPELTAEQQAQVVYVLKDAIAAA